VAPNEALRWIAKRATAWLGLNSATFFIEGHRVEIKLCPVCVTHDEAYGEIVFSGREAKRMQSRLDRVQVRERHYEVEVFVRASLPPD
jgi:hypothetical protein